MADADPSNSGKQGDQAASQYNLGLVQREAGRKVDALRSHRAALEIFQKLAASNPSEPEYRSNAAGALFNLGLLHRESGHHTEALRCFEQALALWEKLGDQNPEGLFVKATAFAQISELEGREGKGKAAGDQAMHLLRQVIAAGYRAPKVTELNDLDPLRSRPDFPLLMMDIMVPVDPFAR